MPYPLPPTLSPSRVTAFTECALAYRFANLDRLPEPPSPHAVKGTLVHAALERLFALPAAERTPEAAAACLGDAVAALRDGRLDGDVLDALGFDDAGLTAFVADAERLLDRYFQMEDPTAVHCVGIELRLEADLGDLRLRGIIDRLDLLPDGSFRVVDYKTGRAATEKHEKRKLLGVDAYALLVQRALGVLPSAVRLLHLADGVAITCTPSAQNARFIEKKVEAVWATIRRANATDAFRPQPGRRCEWCAFQAWCPTFGGDPDEARALGERLHDERAVASGAAGTLPHLAPNLPFGTAAAS